MRQGTAFNYELMFESGFPDSNVNWTVYDEAGASAYVGQTTPASGSVSLTLTVPSNSNLLGVGQFYGWRDLVVTYAVGGVQQRLDHRYILESALPFGVRAEGVRTKLGIDKQDLPDDDIPLLRAYLSFRTLVTAATLDALGAVDSIQMLAVADAIEATAALSVLASLQVRVAQKESSGTNQYQRADIDWSTIETELRNMVDHGITVVSSVTTLFGDGTNLFVLTTPTLDLFPG